MSHEGLQRPTSANSFPQGRRSPSRPSVETLEFFSDPNSGSVYVYNEFFSVVATLAGFRFPAGLATDSLGNLYVPDLYKGHVKVYEPPYTGPPTTLNDPRQSPSDVAVDTEGNVAVTSDGPGTEPGLTTPLYVAFYTAGSTNPTHQVLATSFLALPFCAFDRAGNLYVDGLYHNTSTRIGEITGGIGGTTISPLTTSNTLRDLGGIQVTPNGLVAVLDQRSTATIYTYNPPINGSLGSPVQTTVLEGSTGVVTFAFDASGQHVLAAGPTGEYEYNYPAGGSPVQTSFGEFYGTAVTPTEQF